MNDLKKLEKEIKENVSKLKDQKKLEEIRIIIGPLRRKMDKYDPFLVNVKDGLKRFFLRGIKKEIINDLFDIVEGFENYSEEDKRYALRELERIASIHERTFWEKVIDVLRGS